MSTEIAQTLDLPRRVDALPEFMEYKDTGCDISPTCLACPLAKCRYDGGHPHIMAYASRRQKALIMHRAGVKADGIALLLAISKRQAFRYLREGER